MSVAPKRSTISRDEADIKGSETPAAQPAETARAASSPSSPEPSASERQRAPRQSAVTKSNGSPAKHAELPATLRDLAQSPRVTVRCSGAPDPAGKCVLYWMQRAQRGRDNHAVDLAVTIANELELPLVVYFAGIANFPHANLRHYVFLNEGLPDIEEDLAARNIAFVFRRAPHESHMKLIADVTPAIVIGDENPMREPERWRQEIARQISVPFWTVDTDVIVPSKLFPRAQYAAYTMRPRLMKLLPEYLTAYENPVAAHAWRTPQGFQLDSVHEDMTRDWKNFDRTVPPVPAWRGGTHKAFERLRTFTAEILPRYAETRNEPELDGTSRLSPYLHYGHIGPQTIALAVNAEVKKNPGLAEVRDSYFNELITWRELTINFTRYQADYDNERCAETWARTTIAEHARDERDRIYTLEQMEHAETYDELWNAGQLQMVRFGWMHNYMRMYWAKKILEWTPDVATAMRTCVYLNDKYFLDGRDPNGYGGIAWAILGKFDRAWGSRPIFGKIRYMSAASTGRKFNSKQYIMMMRGLPDPQVSKSGKGSAT